MSNVSILNVENWVNTPIKREINPKLGVIWGNDDGYDQLVPIYNPSPLAQPDVEAFLVYDGFDAYTGAYDPSKVMPGGIHGNKALVREIFAIDLGEADKLLRKVFGGAYRLRILDAVRTGPRQQLGFTEILKGLLERRGIVDLDGQVAAFIQAGKDANNTFCYLALVSDAKEVKELFSELRQDAAFVSQVVEFAQSASMTVDEAIRLYIVISANSNLGRAAGKNIPLSQEAGAHPSGGSADMFIVDRRGLPINPIPFDFPGPLARCDFMEIDANYDVYVAEAKKDARLRTHLERLGLTPETYTWENWVDQRAGLRVLYYLAELLHWTIYSDVHNGENFHFNGNNRRYDLEGNVIQAEEFSRFTFPDSGNACHAIQRHGLKATPVWGAASAHEKIKHLIVTA